MNAVIGIFQTKKNKYCFMLSLKSIQFQKEI